jgi:hypothetical protein
MSRADRNIVVEDVWNEVSKGIDHIYRIQAMTPTAYMELYT